MNRKIWRNYLEFQLACTLISGFHRALLQSITFISRPNAPDYTKLRSQNLRCIKILKDIKLKITPTCFGSYAIHHQGVQSCTWLKFVVVHWCLSCASTLYRFVTAWRIAIEIVQDYVSKQVPSEAEKCFPPSPNRFLADNERDRGRQSVHSPPRSRMQYMAHPCRSPSRQGVVLLFSLHFNHRTKNQ